MITKGMLTNAEDCEILFVNFTLLFYVNKTQQYET